MFKKIICGSILGALIIGGILFFNIDNSTEAKAQEVNNIEEQSNFIIGCTNPVLFEWTSHIVNDTENVIIEMVTDNSDTQYDLIVYTGGVADSWIEDIEYRYSDFNCLRKLGKMALALPEVENESITYNDNIYLSLNNAEIICLELCETIISLDEGHRASYIANTNTYLAQIEALNNSYSQKFYRCENKDFAFNNSNLLQYLANDYDLNIHEFDGVVVNTEKIYFADDLDVETYQTVREENPNIRVFTINTFIDSTSSGYLTEMEQNLEVIYNDLIS